MKQVDVNNLKDIICKCGSPYFTQLTRLKYISALQSPEGKEGVIRMTGLVCVECGSSDTEAINHFDEEIKKQFELLTNKGN